MANSFTVEIPDIGNFDSVDVIDILVNIGDEISQEDPLITVESDKASMDIPSPTNGIVKKILIKVGDKVKQGSLIIETESMKASQEKVPNTPPETIKKKILNSHNQP